MQTNNLLRRSKKNKIKNKIKNKNEKQKQKTGADPTGGAAT